MAVVNKWSLFRGGHQLMFDFKYSFHWYLFCKCKEKNVLQIGFNVGKENEKLGHKNHSRGLFTVLQGRGNGVKEKISPPHSTTIAHCAPSSSPLFSSSIIKVHFKFSFLSHFGFFCLRDKNPVLCEKMMKTISGIYEFIILQIFWRNKNILWELLKLWTTYVF